MKSKVSSEEQTGDLDDTNELRVRQELHLPARPRAGTGIFADGRSDVSRNPEAHLLSQRIRPREFKAATGCVIFRITGNP